MTPHTTEHSCPSCGQSYPEGSLICPACHVRVVTSFMANPPRWFIILLLAVIAMLLIYAVVTAFQVLVQHNF